MGSPSGNQPAINGQSNAFNSSKQVVQMVAPGPAKLDKAERRRLIKEIREEIKPLCSQIADF